MDSRLKIAGTTPLCPGVFGRAHERPRRGRSTLGEKQTSFRSEQTFGEGKLRRSEGSSRCAGLPTEFLFRSFVAELFI